MAHRALRFARTFTVVGVPFCLFSSFALAEWKSSVNVDATATGLYWTDGTLSPDNAQFRDIYILKIPTIVKNGRTWKLRFLPLLQADPSNPSGVDPQHPQRNERYYWDVQEGYVQYQSSPWTMQVGMNVQAWGDTDVFNPIDVVNSHRYYDPFLSEKIGAPTVLVRHESEKVIVEGLYIPYQPETLLPGEESRWLPRTNVYQSRAFTGQPGPNGTTLNGTVNLPSNFSYHYWTKADLTASNRDNFGGRVKFRLPGFDWTLAGFEGAAPAPAVNIVNIPNATVTLVPGTSTASFTVGSDIDLQALYYKNRMLGTSFVWVLGEFLVKGSSAQNHVVSSLAGATVGGESIASRLPGDDWENVLGLERTFQVGSGQLTTMLQGTYVKRNEALDTNSVSIARMFDKAAMIGLRWAPNEKWAVLVSGLYDFMYKDNFEHVEASYKVTDGWNVRLAGDQLGGPPETPLGTYSQNDRVLLSLNMQK